MSWWEIILGVFGYVAVAATGAGVVIALDESMQRDLQKDEFNVIMAGFISLFWPLIAAIGLLVGSLYGIGKVAQYTGVRVHAVHKRHEVRQAKIKALEEEVGIGKDMILYDERSGGIG